MTTITSRSKTTRRSPNRRMSASGTPPTGGMCSAFGQAKAHDGQPSFIAVRTIIGWPAPTKQNTGQSHGSALGAEEVAATKRILGFDPDVNFPAEEETVAHARMVADRAKRVRAEWEETFA